MSNCGTKINNFFYFKILSVILKFFKFQIVKISLWKILILLIQRFQNLRNFID